MHHPKLESLIDRLVYKMGKSQTPVPGFMLGLSGTDSIVAYIICYEAAKRMGIDDNVHGIHFINGYGRNT